MFGLDGNRSAHVMMNDTVHLFEHDYVTYEYKAECDGAGTMSTLGFQETICSCTTPVHRQPTKPDTGNMLRAATNQLLFAQMAQQSAVVSLQQTESLGHMVIFQRRQVVVLDGQRVAGLDQEVVVHALVV